MSKSEIEIIIEREAPEWLRRAMLRLEARVATLEERIITLSDAQAHMNADLSQMNVDLQSIISKLKAQAGSNIMDLSELDAFAASLHQAAGGTSAPTPATPTPVPTASTPVDSTTTTPGGGPGVVTIAGMPLYEFSGDPATIDATHWTLTDLETTDTPPKPLYTFTGDTVNGEPKGSDASWTPYTGNTQAASSSTTTPANAPAAPAATAPAAGPVIEGPAGATLGGTTSVGAEPTTPPASTP